MKKFLVLIFLFNYSAFAQKNIVAVPLADVVAKKKVLIQPSVAASKDALTFGNVLTFGFGNNFQAGINVTDVTFNFGPEDVFFPIEQVQPGVNPEVLVNFQKGFNLNSKTWLAIGTLTGANIATEGSNFSMFNYINGQTQVFGKNIVLLGAYHGEETYLVTNEQKFGIMAGVEIPLTQKWTLLGDYISGNNARSYIHTGLAVKLGSEWSLMGAAGFPAPDSGNKTTGILQLSYLGK